MSKQNLSIGHLTGTKRYWTSGHNVIYPVEFKQFGDSEGVSFLILPLPTRRISPNVGFQDIKGCITKNTNEAHDVMEGAYDNTNVLRAQSFGLHGKIPKASCSHDFHQVMNVQRWATASGPLRGRLVNVGRRCGV